MWLLVAVTTSCYMPLLHCCKNDRSVCLHIPSTTKCDWSDRLLRLHTACTSLCFCKEQQLLLGIQQCDSSGTKENLAPPAGLSHCYHVFFLLSSPHCCLASRQIMTSHSKLTKTHNTLYLLLCIGCFGCFDCCLLFLLPALLHKPQTGHESQPATLQVPITAMHSLL